MAAAATSFAMIAAAMQGSDGAAEPTAGHDARAALIETPRAASASPAKAASDAKETVEAGGVEEHASAEPLPESTRIGDTASPASHRGMPGGARLETELRQALGSALQGLMLTSDGDRLVIRGVLPTREAADRLHARLDAVLSGPVVSRRFAAAPEVIDRLSEAVPDGLQVRHAGSHHFEVAGVVADVARTTAAVDRIATDLKGFGVDVAVRLQPKGGKLPPMSGLFVDNHGTTFLRTSDGVKHIVVPSGKSLPTDVPGAYRPAPSITAPMGQEP